MASARSSLRDRVTVSTWLLFSVSNPQSERQSNVEDKILEKRTDEERKTQLPWVTGLVPVCSTRWEVVVLLLIGGTYLEEASRRMSMS